MNSIENNQITNNLKSYIYNSLFYDIIRYPDGANIAPHNDDYDHNMGIYGERTYFEIKSIEKSTDGQFSIKGVFKTINTKGISINEVIPVIDVGEFKTNDKKGKKNYCIVTNSGDFTSELSFDESQVSMTTTVNVSRTVEGTDLDRHNHRDNFFTCLSNEDSSGTVTYTEHFVKIANGTRLLHYSDEYEYFEIFELPDNWSIENGLSLEKFYYPKVFDDEYYDKYDKDIEEVLNILSERKKVGFQKKYKG